MDAGGIAFAEKSKVYRHLDGHGRFSSELKISEGKLRAAVEVKQVLAPSTLRLHDAHFWLCFRKRRLFLGVFTRYA